MSSDMIEVEVPHIAIIDDEPNTVDLLKKAFSKRNIPISFTAKNGLDGAYLFQNAERKPDVIIMDNRMPVFNGIETTMKILSIAPKTRIIFLTADESVKDAALEAGAVEFLKKPVNIKTIIDAVRKVT